MDISIQSMADLALNQAMAARPNLSTANMASIDKTAQNFEGMFMTQMLQPMFESVHVDEMFGGGHGEEVMRSFMVQEFGKMAAKTGSLGIAPAIKREMIRMQAAQSARTLRTDGMADAISAPTNGV